MPESPRKTVLITGASSGLGAATALACAAAGHRVAIGARRVDRLEALAGQIGRPDDVLVLPLDVRDPESIAGAVGASEARFGGIDALVANAGIFQAKRFATAADSHWTDPFDVNVLGVIRCVRAVLPGMLARGSGHVLTVSSVAGEVPSPGMIIYSATKGAVTAFTEGLRREVAPHGIQVTTLIPGFIESEMTQGEGLPPARIVGDLVVDLLRRPRPRAVIPGRYGFMIWANRVAPRAVDAWLRAKSRKR